MFNRKVSFFLLLLGIFCGSQAGWAEKFRYEFPTNLRLSIEPNDATEEKTGNKITLNAFIECLVGNLQNIEIYFTSSSDLRVVNASSNLKNLPSGSRRKIKILVLKTGKQLDEMGSWVKMGVRYRPDYPAIRELVSNKQAYGDEKERLRLLEILEKNQATDENYHQITRFFFK